MSELKARNEAAFSDPDSTFEDYRAFSPVALFAFVFALISAIIGMATTWLVAIPALLFGLAILTYLHWQSEKVIGYTLAILSIAVCVFAIGANIVYHRARISYLARTAEEYAHQWLEMSQQGMYHETYQMTLTLAKRQKPGTMLAKVYGDEKNPLDDFRKYLNSEPERTIRLDGDGGQFSTLQISHQDSGVDREQFIIRIKFEPENTDLGERIFDLHMERKKHLPQFGPIQWTVEGVKNIKPAIGRGSTAEKG